MKPQENSGDDSGGCGYRSAINWPARHISRYIDCKPAEVSAFLADHRNLPKWAAGLSAGISEENGVVLSESPMGKVQVHFTARAERSIFDHDVTLPGEKTFHNPLRVLGNDEGSEVVFTLYRLAGVSDEAYEKDAATIADLIWQAGGTTQRSSRARFGRPARNRTRAR